MKMTSSLLMIKRLRLKKSWKIANVKEATQVNNCFVLKEDLVLPRKECMQVILNMELHAIISIALFATNRTHPLPS